MSYKIEVFISGPSGSRKQSILRDIENILTHRKLEPQIILEAHGLMEKTEVPFHLKKWTWTPKGDQLNDGRT